MTGIYLYIERTPTVKINSRSGSYLKYEESYYYFRFMVGLLYFLLTPSVFDVGRHSIVSGAIENMVLQYEIGFLSKIERKLLLLLVYGRPIVFSIDSIGFRCR
jgi:hypothetical protein